MKVRKFDRKHFYTTVKRLGALNQKQVDAINFLLDKFEEDGRISDIRYIAYMLATVKHETADTYLPIAEYGRGKGRSYGAPDAVTGQVYYGRGYVQLTWKANSVKMKDRLAKEGKDIDLVNNPDLAMLPAVAYDIMVIGMLEGSFTGKKLSQYISDTKCDYMNARRIINGTDKARLIASYANIFEEALKVV